jgi:dihydrofolate reductase
MNKLILQSQVSVDGFMAAADGSTDWMAWNWGPDWTWDPDLQRHHAEIILSASTVLLAGKTPEVFVDHWREIAEHETGSMHDFAHHLGYTEKVVFSSTLREVPYDDTTVISGDLAAEVTALKQRSRGDVIAFGGASFAGGLLAAGVVDDLHLFINPIALGSGMPLFDQLAEPLQLELVESRRFGHGLQTTHYRVGSAALSAD